MVDKALARKYRPQTFDEMVGQAAVVKTLKNALATGRVHPAYIFSGIRGVGKTTAARLFAKGLNCSTGVTPDPCNACPSCTEVAKSSSMDVLEIDGATHTGVDQVRDLTQAARYRPVRDRYRVFIIDEVHMLSRAAFNALLKTLEEPPDHVVFILATTEPRKVPETIRSRAQHFEFKRVSSSRVADFLADLCEKEEISAEAGALELVARSGEGSIRDCLTLLDRLRTYSDGDLREVDAVDALGLVGREGLENLLALIAKADTTAVSFFVDDLRENGRDGERFLKDFTSFIREVLRAKNTGPATDEGESGEAGRTMTYAALFSEEDLIRLYDLLLETQRRTKGAPDPEAVLELQLIKAAMLPKILPLDRILGAIRDRDLGLPSDEPPPPAAAPVEVKTRVEEKEPEDDEPKTNITFKGIMAFGQMDEQEAESYDRNTSLDRFKDMAVQRMPLVASGLNGANLSLDPDGVLHIRLKANSPSAGTLLARPESLKKLEKIALELGFSGSVQITTEGTEEDETRPSGKEKEDRVGSSAADRVLEILGGKVVKSNFPG